MPSIKAILSEYDIHPRKSLGQHFLTHDGYLQAIARAANLTKSDTVLEIGAGVGNLTKILAAQGGKVIAIEFDKDMLRVLHGEIGNENVQIVEADALKIDFRSFRASGKMVVVGNLPYNIATEIVFRLFDARDCFSRMLLMTQLEVARRYAAPAGSKEYGVLTVLSGLWAKIKIEMTVPAGAFHPRPKVDSAVVRFEMRDSAAADIHSPEMFSKIVHAAFSQRRKMLINSLTAGAYLGLDKAAVLKWLDRAGVDPGVRAQNLTIEDYARLEREFPSEK